MEGISGVFREVDNRMISRKRNRFDDDNKLLSNECSEFDVHGSELCTLFSADLEEEYHVLSTDPADTLPLHLSEYALHDYSMTQYADCCYPLKQDDFYGNVKVVDIFGKGSSAKNIKTFRIIFEASLPADKTTQTFITKISLSFSDPPLSTVKIGFHSVKIKGEESDCEDNEDDEEEEENLSDSVCYEDDPEIDSESDVEDHSKKILLEDSESVVEDHSQEILLEFHKKDTQENLSGLGDRVHGETSSESDDKLSKNSEFFESDEKHSKDSQDSLYKSDEKHSKVSEENLSKFCDGKPPKDSVENLSKLKNMSHAEDSQKNPCEFEEKDTKTGVRYYCHADTHFTPMKQKYKGSELSKEIKSFSSQVAKSDGFEVGRHPLMDAAGIRGTWIYKFYDGETTPLCFYDMNNLVCLSCLAICIYNVEKNTRFGSVEVLKAMTFAGTGVGYNITFKASLPDNTTGVFQTRISTNIPLPYAKIEIEFVRVKPN